MKLSVTTIAWGKLKTPAEFEKVLDSIGEIGFQGVGIENSLLPIELKKNPGLLGSLVKQSALENGGTYSRARTQDIEWARRSKTPLFWVSIIDVPFSDALRQLRTFSKRARDAQIITALHNELRSAIETEDEIVQALEKIPELSLCLDTAHAIGAGVSCERLIEEYVQRIKLVHLKDLRKILPKSKIRFRTDFVNVGTGALDLRSIVRKLSECGYNGQLMLEIEALGEQHPTQAVRQGYAHMQKIMATLA